MTDENNTPIPEEEDNIVELTDEDGVVTKFEHLATISHEGEEYVVLLMLDEDGNEPDTDDSEVYILQIEQDENGEDIYVTVEDDDVSQAVFDKFVALMDEEDEE